jgi:hypothetical protein
VQRTHDRFAGDDAVTQGAALVRALVVGGKDAIAEVEQRDLAIAESHRSPFAQRQILERGHTDPAWFVHAST